MPITPNAHIHTSIRRSHAIRGNKKHYNRTPAAPLEVQETPPKSEKHSSAAATDAQNL